MNHVGLNRPGTAGKQQESGGSHGVHGLHDQSSSFVSTAPDAVDTGEAHVLLQTRSRVLNGAEETMGSIDHAPTFTGIRLCIIVSPLPQYLSVKNHRL
jgi:hypothetical protein